MGVDVYIIWEKEQEMEYRNRYGNKHFRFNRVEQLHSEI